MPAFAFDLVDDGGDEPLVFLDGDAVGAELDHAQAEALGLAGAPLRARCSCFSSITACTRRRVSSLTPFLC
jgi:hypothetical protein